MTANEVGLLEYNRALKEDQNVTTKILRILAPPPPSLSPGDIEKKISIQINMSRSTV